MDVLYSKKFLKDIEQINDRKIKKNIETFIETLTSVSNLKNISGLRKMVGYENYYRIRLGKYRLGLKYESNKITFLRFKHRKDIYDVFP